MIAHIRGEAFRTTEELLDPRLFQGRHTAHRIHQQRFEMFKAARDFIEAEIFGYAVHSPRSGIGFERPYEQFPGVIFIIAAIIIIPQNRQCGVDTLDAFEQHIIMFARMQRCRDADARGEIAGPHSAANHDIVRIDRTFGGIDAGHPVTIVPDFCNLGIFKYPGAAGACTLGQCLRDVDGIGIAIAGDVDAADNIVDIHNMREVLDLLRRNDMHGQIEHLSHGCAALQFFETLSIGGHRDGTALAIAGRLPGLRL